MSRNDCSICGAVTSFAPTNHTLGTMRSRMALAVSSTFSGGALRLAKRRDTVIWSISPRPAKVEHPLVAPLVAELLEERRNEGGDGLVGVDRRRREALFHRLDDGGGVLDAGVVRGHHQRHEGEAGVLGEEVAGGGAVHPLVVDVLVAEVRAHLDRIGRLLRTDHPIAIRHAKLPRRSKKACEYGQSWRQWTAMVEESALQPCAASPAIPASEGLMRGEGVSPSKRAEGAHAAAPDQRPANALPTAAKTRPAPNNARRQARLAARWRARRPPSKALLTRECPRTSHCRSCRA